MQTVCPQSVDKRERGYSLAFWATLLIAAALYAAVSLSPKLLAYTRLKNDHYRNQVRLVSLEQEVGYLAKVAKALEHDPHFAEELARVDLSVARPGDERISVDGQAMPELRSPRFDARQQSRWQSLYLPVLEGLATHATLRMGLVGFAATAVIVAFTFLHYSPHSRRKKSAPGRFRTAVAAMVNRYRKTTPSA